MKVNVSLPQKYIQQLQSISMNLDDLLEYSQGFCTYGQREIVLFKRWLKAENLGKTFTAWDVYRYGIAVTQKKPSQTGDYIRDPTAALERLVNFPDSVLLLEQRSMIAKIHDRLASAESSAYTTARNALAKSYNKREAALKTQKNRLYRQIDALDKKIDALNNEFFEAVERSVVFSTTPAKPKKSLKATRKAAA